MNEFHHGRCKRCNDTKKMKYLILKIWCIGMIILCIIYFGLYIFHIIEG